MCSKEDKVAGNRCVAGCLRSGPKGSKNLSKIEMEGEGLAGSAHPPPQIPVDGHQAASRKREIVSSGISSAAHTRSLDEICTPAHPCAGAVRPVQPMKR
jgi:hypothetical protein